LDDIQRKLARIDAQRAGWADRQRKIITTTPLLFVAVGLMIGIVTQSIADWPVWFWAMLPACGALGTMLFFGIRKEAPVQVFAYMALGCFACLGAIRLMTFTEAEPNDITNLVGDDRRAATIAGTVVTEPHINRNQQWEFAKFDHSDPGSSFYLRIVRVKTLDGWANVTGTVRVQVAEPVMDLKTGDYIQAYCWLARFKPPTNPGQFNTAEYLARKRVFVAASVKSRAGIELLQGGKMAWSTKVKSKLRRMASAALLDDMPVEDASRGLLEALLLGYRGHIEPETYVAFRKTGLLHFISLSGMHLGIFMGIIWWLCKAAGLLKRARAIICIIAIGVFLLIVPPRAPTVRAAIICWVFCLSFFFRRRSNPLNTLSLAAIILLLIRPTGLFEAGWQLSFASVLGILLFSDRIHFFLYEKITSIPWKREKPKTSLLLRVTPRPGPPILLLFSIGFGAWFGGAGIVLYHFHMINPFTCIWKLAMFPLVGLVLALGYLKIVLSLLLPSGGAVLGAVVDFLCHSMIIMVKHIAGLHIGSWELSHILIGSTPAMLIVFYYCVVSFGFFGNFRRPVVKKMILTAAVAVIIVFLGVTKWQRTHCSDLVLTCLDVGHGQAIAAQLPGGATVIFDAGSIHRTDIGRRIVAPFLQYNGINTVDAIVVSHGDIDHINGIPEIVKSCKVTDAYAGDAFFMAVERRPRPPAATLKTSLDAKGLDVQVLSGALNLSSSAHIKTIWPSKEVCENRRIGENDKSLVLLIEFGGAKILLCSDIEKYAQGELLRQSANLKVDVAVVPHHGSVKTLEPPFLEKLDPEILICSCGRSGYERQQAAGRTYKSKVFYTARDGAVTVRIDSNGAIRAYKSQVGSQRM
jgi:competence protein ComEC